MYGFDYDYTLAVYTRELNPLIYRLALKRLVEHYNVGLLFYRDIRQWAQGDIVREDRVGGEGVTGDCID